MNKDEQNNQQRPIDSLLKKNFSNLARQAKLVRKCKIRTWKALAIVTFIAGFTTALVWIISFNLGQPSESATQVSNQAQVTFEDESSNPYGPNSSNIVVTQIQTSETEPREFDFKLERQARQTHSGLVTLSIYEAGTQTIVATTTKQVGSGGTATAAKFSEKIPDNTYDMRLKITYYLIRKLANIAWPPTQQLNFGIIRAGNLNDDSVINSLDWSIMNTNWATDNAVADINADGIVNTVDWSVMNSNWNQDNE